MDDSISVVILIIVALVDSVVKCESEMIVCLDQSFHYWSNKKWQGVGVQKFKTFPKSNNFVSKKNALSSLVWISAIELNTNYSNLRGVPGVSIASTLCRRD